MYLGDYIQIESQTGSFEFCACSVSTGTQFLAYLDEDKRDLFADQAFTESHPSACPFLRLSGDHVICTIHKTRPSQCRAYRCVSMRIFSVDGSFRGSVSGSLALSSEDATLRELWEQVLSEIPFYSQDAEDRLAQLIEQNGYIVV